MDFSFLSDAMASKSYDKIADICDDHILQAHTLNSARFLWKSIPSSVKESRPELVAVWKICQRLWMRDHAGVHEAIRGFNWSQETRDLVASFSDVYTKKMFQLLLSAYSTISIQDASLFLGMNEDDATNYVLQQGWSVDPASRMLTVKKLPVVTEQKLDPSKLQRLTEYNAAFELARQAEDIVAQWHFLIPHWKTHRLTLRFKQKKLANPKNWVFHVSDLVLPLSFFSFTFVDIGDGVVKLKQVLSNAILGVPA
ncbi:hypothetical protein TEA_028191 [Camellia sinensis var. sinensis]|uniref:CSN8/PSMD8/EIF3K domain-containing protein n=1 Tax=Camellia sinensis var. sinensis TaxID=542762 RepID=A0A4S4DF07_CAMSN|nr:hypothetical protein TEA_028191 [Camellia sinensis var. sinensis]